MSSLQAPAGMYQERKALVDRIRFYETSAARFGEDWRARMVEAPERHIACARARLERIERTLAAWDGSAAA